MEHGGSPHRTALWVRMAALRPQRPVAHVTVGPPPAWGPGPPRRRAALCRPATTGQPACREQRNRERCLHEELHASKGQNQCCMQQRNVGKPTGQCRLGCNCNPNSVCPTRCTVMHMQCRIMHAHSFTVSRKFSRFSRLRVLACGQHAARLTWSKATSLPSTQTLSRNTLLTQQTTQESFPT